jgi:hypothetical protein
LVVAIGIGCSTKTNYSVPVLAALKLFSSVMFQMPILAEGMLSGERFQHQNRLPFSLLLSFGQTKERRECCTSKEKEIHKQTKEEGLSKQNLFCRRNI